MCYVVPHRIDWDCEDCGQRMFPMWEHRFFCSNVPGALRPVLVDETHECLQGFLYDPTRGFSVEHLPPGPDYPKPEPGICQDCEAQRTADAEEAARAEELAAQEAEEAAEAEALAAQEAHERRLADAFAQMQAAIPTGGWVNPDNRPQVQWTVAEQQQYQQVWNRYGEEAANMWWDARSRNR